MAALGVARQGMAGSYPITPDRDAGLTGVGVVIVTVFTTPSPAAAGFAAGFFAIAIMS